MATTFLLPSAKNVHPVQSGPTGPGGRRLSLVQWGEYGRYFRQPGLGTLLVQFLVFTFSFAMFVSALALFVERRITWHGKPFGPEQTGYVWAYAGLLGVGLQGPALGRLVKRFGERALNRTGFAAYVVGYSLLAFAHSIPWLLMSTTVLAIGGLVRPTLTSMITQKTARDEQGTVLGLTQSLTSVSQIVGPPLAGLLIQHDLLTAWGLALAAVALLGVAISSRPLAVEAHA
jgi:DHA1 family tetracycline resistance protein-like MFS transporter